MGKNSNLSSFLLVILAIFGITSKDSSVSAAVLGDDALAGMGKLQGNSSVNNPNGSETDSIHISDVDDNGEHVSTGYSNAGIGYLPGSLEIITVPNFDFGIQTIDGNTDTYELANPGSKRDLIVRDNSGSRSGWTVNVKLASLAYYNLNNVTKTGVSDPGSQIILAPGNNVADNGSGTELSRDEVKVSYGKYDKTNGFSEITGVNGSTNGVKPKEVVLKDVGTSSGDIAQASSGNGIGTFDFDFNPKGTAFYKIDPNKQRSDTKYVYELDWSLTSGQV